MLTPALITARLAADPADAIPPERLTPQQAARLEGERVTVRFTPAAAPYTWRDRTVTGIGEGEDGVERAVVLRGWRLDAEAGRTLTVTGTLRVIRHPTAAVKGVIVPAWTEIRVEE